MKLHSLKGQSAIEYLTTYGWMLLVVAIVGGSIFTTVSNQGQIRDTSGLSNADVQVEEFGVTENGFQAELRGSTSDRVEDVEFTITDPETDESVTQQISVVPVGDRETVSLDGVESSETTDTYNVEIEYDSGGLENLEETGTITAAIELASDGINGTVSVNPDISGATVEAYSDGSLVETTTTDSSGEYSFSTSVSEIDRLVVSSENDINLNGQPLYAGAEITSVSSSPVNFDFNESAAWTDVEVNGNNVTIANQLESKETDSLPIANVEMLQAMQENDTENYSIIRNISASETQNWNYDSTGGNYSGFDPVETEFTGNFDGENNAINGLHINRPNEDKVGIFSVIDNCDGGEQGNFTVSNFNVTGKESVGYLAGDVFGPGLQNETVSFEGINNLEGESVVGKGYSNLAGDDSGCSFQSIPPL